MSDVPFAEFVDVSGVEHVARLSPVFYRGAQPEGVEGYSALERLGIRTVISLRQFHSGRKDAEAAGLKYYRLPVQASVLGSEPPEEEQVERFFQLVLDPAHQPVFIHCMTGKDRTGTLSALYRMEVDGWSHQQAEAELLAFGYHTIYDDLIRYVREYRPRGFAPAKP